MSQPIKGSRRLRAPRCPHVLPQAGILLVLFSVSACESKSACEKNGAEAEISGNHKHGMSVPVEHIKRAVGGMYPIKGAADHDHIVNLSDADMEKLKKGEPVQTRSTSVNAHIHEVGVRCKE